MSHSFKDKNVYKVFLFIPYKMNVEKKLDYTFNYYYSEMLDEMKVAKTEVSMKEWVEMNDVDTIKELMKPNVDSASLFKSKVQKLAIHDKITLKDIIGSQYKTDADSIALYNVILQYLVNLLIPVKFHELLQASGDRDIKKLYEETTKTIKFMQRKTFKPEMLQSVDDAELLNLLRTLLSLTDNNANTENENASASTGAGTSTATGANENAGTDASTNQNENENLKEGLGEIFENETLKNIAMDIVSELSSDKDLQFEATSMDDMFKLLSSGKLEVIMQKTIKCIKDKFGENNVNMDMLSSEVMKIVTKMMSSSAPSSSSGAPANPFQNMGYLGTMMSMFQQMGMGPQGKGMGVPKLDDNKMRREKKKLELQNKLQSLKKDNN